MSWSSELRRIPSIAIAVGLPSWGPQPGAESLRALSFGLAGRREKLEYGYVARRLRISLCQWRDLLCRQRSLHGDRANQRPESRAVHRTQLQSAARC